MVVQRDFDRLEEGADRNLMKFSNKNCKVLHLQRNNSRYQNGLGQTCCKAALQSEMILSLCSALVKHSC